MWVIFPIYGVLGSLSKLDWVQTNFLLLYSVIIFSVLFELQSMMAGRIVRGPVRAHFFSHTLRLFKDFVLIICISSILGILL